MKIPLDLFVEKTRITHGDIAGLNTDSTYGPNGAFLLLHPASIYPMLFVIASDGMGWDHVSVTCKDARRCPTWEEMCWVKDLFWDKDEVVIQYHPAEKDYINNHPYCLHLFKPQGVFPVPLPEMVGLKRKVKRH